MQIVIHNFSIDAKKKANLAYVFVYISCLLSFLFYFLYYNFGFQNCSRLLLGLLFFGHFYFPTEHLCVCVCTATRVSRFVLIFICCPPNFLCSYNFYFYSACNLSMFFNSNCSFSPYFNTSVVVSIV